MGRLKWPRKELPRPIRASSFPGHLFPGHPNPESGFCLEGFNEAALSRWNCVKAGQRTRNQWCSVCNWSRIHGEWTGSWNRSIVKFAHWHSLSRWHGGGWKTRWHGRGRWSGEWKTRCWHRSAGHWRCDGRNRLARWSKWNTDLANRWSFVESWNFCHIKFTSFPSLVGTLKACLVRTAVLPLARKRRANCHDPDERMTRDSPAPDLWTNTCASVPARTASLFECGAPDGIRTRTYQPPKLVLLSLLSPHSIHDRLHTTMPW